MHFIERDEGEYRIYAGAIEKPRGEGYLAAVVVQRLSGGACAQEIFREDALCAGYGWPTPDAALAFALRKAQGVLRAKQPRRPAVASLPEAAKLAFAAGTRVGRRRPPAVRAAAGIGGARAASLPALGL